MMLLGVFAGFVWGVFWGESGAWVGWAGDAYIGLLQMTVLPYVVLSLILNIGRLSKGESGRLARICTATMLLLWLLALSVLIAMSCCFPEWEGGSFFSVTMFDQPEPMNWLALFIPSNFFASLTNELVPAVVLFSVGFGIALMLIPERKSLLNNIEIMVNGLGNLNHMVVRIAPLGMFAIVAKSAGTISPFQFQLLQGYLLVYGSASLLISLWVFPLLISCCTPFSYRDVMRESRSALITAFVIGNTFVVMPMIAEAVNRLTRTTADDPDSDMPTAGYTVQLAYPFPDAGRIIGLIFIPFAAWFYGLTIPLTDSLPLIGTGLLSSFAKPIVTTPMLLDMARIPTDIFNLYLSVGVVAARFGDLMKAMNLFAFSVLTASYLTGVFNLNIRRIATALIATTIVMLIGIVGIRIFLERSFQEQFSRDDLTMSRGLLASPVKSTVLPMAKSNPVELKPGEDRINRILRRGVIRIGFNPEELPFCYYNGEQDLVGFDMDMAHQLARDLNVTIEFVPIEENLVASLRNDHIDVAMSQFEGTIGNAIALPEMESYLQVTQAIVVPDYRRKQFDSLESLREQLAETSKLRVAYVAQSIASENLRDEIRNLEQAPGLGTGAAAVTRAGITSELEFVEVPSEREFFETGSEVADVLVTSAEVGSAWTLKYPNYSVVRPAGLSTQIPLYYYVAEESRFQDFLNSWLVLKKSNGTIDQLFDYWILGRDSNAKPPRWCIARDILNWID